ncbi:MAG: 30S ribosomal protein S20 [Pseudomonadota bacterium]
MANSKQATKRARQAVGRRAHNMSLRSRMRTMIKRVRKAISEGDAAGANEHFKAAAPVIDGMVSKGVLHRNAAARYKSRLNSAILKLNA